MLYVSRHDGINFYGVADTEDGSEEIVTRSKLIKCVEELGMVIHGADFLPYAKRVADTVPYQPKETMTQLQMKTKLVKFTEVKVYKNMVTSIHYRHKEIREPVTLRLSDYGSECADCILWENDQALRHVITILLDDKIKVGKFTFRRDEAVRSLGPNGYGVKFDLTGVTDYAEAEALYRQFRAQDGAKCLSYIIDSPERTKQIRKFFGLVG